MWFLRGSGMKGFGGIRPAAGDGFDRRRFGLSWTIVRPFFETSKAEISNYLDATAN